MKPYNATWYRRIWAHRRKALDNPTKYALPGLWTCIRASIALKFDRWESKVEPRICEDFDGWKAVAWENAGTYETDYGTGHAWSTLVVRGLTIATYDDGDL